MPVTTSNLRSNIYNYLDEVLETGTPLFIERKGKLLKIVPEREMSKWNNVITRKGLHASGKELLDTSWEDTWNP